MDGLFDDEDSERLFTVVHMFQRTALVCLGMIADHEGKEQWNPAEAKAAIDMLLMVQRKTKGNLSDKEDALLKGVISELQLEFVKSPDRRAKQAEAMQEMEQVAETFLDPANAPVEVVADDSEE